MIGQTLSHYRITAALGAGGMGEVYRATDTNLQRDVAIKVLPPEVGQDPERLARFKREALLLASLNHPNIAAIYGLEEADGKPFLALELVEGEDLKERLAKGAIPVDEVLEIAEQIAEALEEAHAKGIVHRDLKPANVKLTPDGKVKVLDFGLAKAWGGDVGSGGSSVDLSQSPTLARTGTLAGVILGTAGYMSPEQASGKGVDKRADIWSFGVVLFEMLTGRPLFSGETPSEVMAAVIKEEPAWDRLPAGCPPAITRLIHRCLRKRPRERLQDIGDARLEIQETRAGTAVGAAASTGDIDEVRRIERGRRSRERRAWAAALVVVLALAGLPAFLALRGARQTPEIRSPAHFTLDAPKDTSFPNEFNPPALAPDGRAVAFVGISSDGTTRLWLRPLDSVDARALPGTDGAGGPFWSPDSAQIGFFAERELRKVVLSSGTVQRLCALPMNGTTGATWSSDGTIVFQSGGAGGSLFSVPAGGGEPKPLTSHDASRGETGHYWPQFLPDGRHVLFVVGSSSDANGGIFVSSLEAPAQRRKISPDGARFWYAKPGYLLSVREGVLSAQRFDDRKLATTGEAVPIATSVATFSQIANWGWFSASDTGRAAWRSGHGGDTRLVWVDRAGRQLGALGEPGQYGQIVLSPDGRRVVAELADATRQYDLWVFDVARGVPSRLTTDPANDRDPVWSPDGETVVYSSDAKGDQNLLLKGLEGSEPPAPLPGGIGQTPGDRDIAKAWIREGNTLLYLTIGAERTLWKVSLNGHGSPEVVAKGFGIDQPHLSPDGRSLAYISQDSGRSEVYVQPFGRRGERVRVSTSGGGQPLWRGDGKELFYLSLDGALMAVSVREGAAAAEFGMPTTLAPAAELRAGFEGPDFSDYCVTPDGQRFLVKRPGGDDSRPQIHVLLDWPSLLGR